MADDGTFSGKPITPGRIPASKRSRRPCPRSSKGRGRQARRGRRWKLSVVRRCKRAGSRCWWGEVDGVLGRRKHVLRDRRSERARQVPPARAAYWDDRSAPAAVERIGRALRASHSTVVSAPDAGHRGAVARALSAWAYERRFRVRAARPPGRRAPFSASAVQRLTHAWRTQSRRGRRSTLHGSSGIRPRRNWRTCGPTGST